MTELKRDIADAMADVIVELKRAGRDHTRDDLLKANFTLEEINRFEPLACGYAALKRQGAKNVA